MSKITKQEIGHKLKYLVQTQHDIKFISDWAHSLYAQYLTDAGSDLDDVLLVLVTMNAGPEFELSYEELDQIAEKLIAGEDVKL